MDKKMIIRFVVIAFLCFAIWIGLKLHMLAESGGNWR